MQYHPSLGEVCLLANAYGCVLCSVYVPIDHDKSLRGLDVLVYIDDILIIQRESQSTSEHLIQVEEVLNRLQSAGFKANLRKSFFIQKSVEYLGYQLTDTGIGPQPKKVEAIVTEEYLIDNKIRSKLV